MPEEKTATNAMAAAIPADAYANTGILRFCAFFMADNARPAGGSISLSPASAFLTARISSKTFFTSAAGTDMRKKLLRFFFIQHVIRVSVYIFNCCLTIHDQPHPNNSI